MARTVDTFFTGKCDIFRNENDNIMVASAIGNDPSIWGRLEAI